MIMQPRQRGHRGRERRCHRVTVMLNDSEFRLLNRYCKQYGLSNRSRLVRETVVRNILKRFDEDNPTLFD